MTEFPSRLKDLLGGVGARIGLEDARATGLLWTRWAEIVGDSVATNAEPTSLKKGILRVRATSPVWAQELTYLTSEIRSRANAIAGADVVREVRIWTGPGEVVRTTVRPSKEAQDGPDAEAADDPPEDLPTAFERAHEAWARRRAQNR